MQRIRQLQTSKDMLLVRGKTCTGKMLVSQIKWGLGWHVVFFDAWCIMKLLLSLLLCFDYLEFLSIRNKIIILNDIVKTSMWLFIVFMQLIKHMHHSLKSEKVTSLVKVKARWDSTLWLWMEMAVKNLHIIEKESNIFFCKYFKNYS